MCIRDSDCTGVEDELDVTKAQRTELDYLIYNDPLGYCLLYTSPKRSPRSSGPLSARCWQQPSRKPPSSRNVRRKKSSKGGWNDEALSLIHIYSRKWESIA